MACFSFFVLSVLLSSVVTFYGHPAMSNRLRGWDHNHNIIEGYPAKRILLDRLVRSKSGSVSSQRQPLECILTQHFTSVFRIANCNSNDAPVLPSSARSRISSPPTALKNATDSLCMWRYRQAPRRLRTVRGEAIGTDPDQLPSSINSTSNASSTSATGATGFSSTGHPPPCLRRLLYEIRSANTPDPSSPTPSRHSIVTLSSKDFTRFPSLWPGEALAYKAHLLALEHCGTAQDGDCVDTATGVPFAGSCAVVTDEQGWVAAVDGAAMNRALRRDDDTDDMGGRMYGSSSSRTATDPSIATATSTATGATTMLPWGRPRCPSRSSHPQQTVNTTTATTTTTALPATSPCRSSRLYTGRAAWLAHVRSGLSRLATAQRHRSRRPVIKTAPTDTARQEQHKLPQHQLLTQWDVLALPSGCSGWALAHANGDVPAADQPSNVTDNISTSIATTTATRRGTLSPNAAAATTTGGAGRYPPPRRTGISGCVLAFRPHAVSTLLQLSVVPPADPTSYSVLLPMTNVPFYAKLGLLARQGVVRLALAVPAKRPGVGPVSDAGAKKTEGTGGGGGHGGGGAAAAAAAAVVRGQIAPDLLPVGLPGPVPGSGGPRRRFLMFTCAGDQARWHLWAHPNRNYDLIVAYYGDLPDGDSRITAGGAGGGLPDFVYRARGSKHQNMHRLHMLHPHLLTSYEVVGVWDDDLVVTADEISGMFERFSSLAGPPNSPDGLWMAQPSLANGSKVSHSVNMNHPALIMSYTSFVEVNAHIFRSDKLVQILDSPSYTGELLGWGVDFAMVAVLGATERRRYAVLHDFQVFNPRNEHKPQGREILKLANNTARRTQWQEYQARMRLPDQPQVAYKCVPRDPLLPPQGYPRYCPEYNQGRA